MHRRAVVWGLLGATVPRVPTRASPVRGKAGTVVGSGAPVTLLQARHRNTRAGRVDHPRQVHFIMSHVLRGRGPSFSTATDHTVWVVPMLELCKVREVYRTSAQRGDSKPCYFQASCHSETASHIKSKVDQKCLAV